MPLINLSNKDIAIIHDDKSGDIIAKAAIINYDKAHQVITISSDFFNPSDTPRVSMLILGKDSIIECQGVVRKYDGLGLREIAVFNAKEKENRNCIRYNIQTEAVIHHLLIAGSPVPLKEALAVQVENISSSGILIRTTSNLFNVNSSFQLKINIGGSDIIINTSVVRICGLDDEENQLGCEFVSVSN